MEYWTPYNSIFHSYPIIASKLSLLRMPPEETNKPPPGIPADIFYDCVDGWDGTKSVLADEAADAGRRSRQFERHLKAAVRIRDVFQSL